MAKLKLLKKERSNDMPMILLVFAFVFFAIGTFWGPYVNPPAPWYGRFNFVSAGLACWVLTLILGKF